VSYTSHCGQYFHPNNSTQLINISKKIEGSVGTHLFTWSTGSRGGFLLHLWFQLSITTRMSCNVLRTCSFWPVSHWLWLRVLHISVTAAYINP